MAPDLNIDVCDGFPFENNSVEEICAFDFMEHCPISKVVFVMSEIHRVLKPEGIFRFSIPSTDGRGAFQDPTHKSFWNINSWLYYCQGEFHDIYPELPLFEVIEIGDVETFPGLRIIHTIGKVRPIK